MTDNATTPPAVSLPDKSHGSILNVNDDEVARYLTALKTACPEITTDELALLRAKLEALRVEITPEPEPID